MNRISRYQIITNKVDKTCLIRERGAYSAIKKLIVRLSLG